MKCCYTVQTGLSWTLNYTLAPNLPHSSSDNHSAPHSFDNQPPAIAIGTKILSSHCCCELLWYEYVQSKHLRARQTLRERRVLLDATTLLWSYWGKCWYASPPLSHSLHDWSFCSFLQLKHAWRAFAHRINDNIHNPCLQPLIVMSAAAAASQSDILQDFDLPTFLRGPLVQMYFPQPPNFAHGLLLASHPCPFKS